MKKRIQLGGDGGPIPGLFRPFVTIEVRDRFGEFWPLRFLLDTGADVSAIPVPVALRYRLPFSRSQPAQLAAGLVSAVQQYRGFIHVRLFGEEFDWPCSFLEAPDPTRTFRYSVLGRIGFLASFDACIERPFCVIERRRDDLPRWQRFAARLFSRSHEVRYNHPL